MAPGPRGTAARAAATAGAAGAGQPPSRGSPNPSQLRPLACPAPPAPQAQKPRAVWGGAAQEALSRQRETSRLLWATATQSMGRQSRRRPETRGEIPTHPGPRTLFTTGDRWKPRPGHPQRGDKGNADGHSALNRKGTLTHPATWTSLEATTPSDKSQTRGQTGSDPSSVWSLESAGSRAGSGGAGWEARAGPPRDVPQGPRERRPHSEVPPAVTFRVLHGAELQADAA